MNQINNIENLIYNVRGVQVMFDFDIANLYHVETKRINEAVKNNPLKFPERYTFRITEKEYDSLKSKISTSRGGARKGHNVFTEQGIYMLATILKSNVATQVSIAIMDTFVKIRKYFSNELISKNVLIDHENRILKIEDSLNKHNNINANNLFFEGQIYDSYSLLIDILSKAKNLIIIIDNYAGKELLDIIKDIKISIIIYSSNIDEQLIMKYNKQYNNVSFKINDSFHDRFIILDNKIFYHSSASFKDLGKKCFAISEFNDKYTVDKLINYLN